MDLLPENHIWISIYGVNGSIFCSGVLALLRPPQKVATLRTADVPALRHENAADHD